MRQFWKGVMSWKTGMSLLYTATMVIYLIFCLISGSSAVSVTILWSLLLVSIAGSLIQAFCFTDWIIKKMRYTRRSLLFVLLFLPALSLAAWKGKWFPIENAGAWLTFIGAFFLTFAVMTIGFDIYFRITGRKYDGMLGQYRKEKEESEE